MKTLITFFALVLTLFSNSFGEDVYGTYKFRYNKNATLAPGFMGIGSFSTFNNTAGFWGGYEDYPYPVYNETCIFYDNWSNNTTRDDNQYVFFIVSLNSPNNFNGLNLKLKFSHFRNYCSSTSYGPPNGEVMHRFGNSGTFTSAGTFNPLTGTWTTNEFNIPANNSTLDKLEIRIHCWNAAGSEDQCNQLYFDNVILSGPSNPTPVELNTFTAQLSNNIVFLNWQTATETDNYGFDIERASVNKAWKKVGFVDGSGNSNSPKNYSFTDKTATSGKYTYRLKQIDANGAFSYSKEVEVDMGIPTDFALEQNYPNPFNPSTMISYQVPVQTMVEISVFNSIGENVATLVNEVKEPGYYEVTWNASSMPSGVYFFRINAGEFSSVKKMMLMK